jgi:hypothetical protein
LQRFRILAELTSLRPSRLQKKVTLIIASAGNTVAVRMMLKPSLDDVIIIVLIEDKLEGISAELEHFS